MLRKAFNHFSIAQHVRPGMESASEFYRLACICYQVQTHCLASGDGCRRWAEIWEGSPAFISVGTLNRDYLSGRPMLLHLSWVGLCMEGGWSLDYINFVWCRLRQVEMLIVMELWKGWCSTWTWNARYQMKKLDARSGWQALTAEECGYVNWIWICILSKLMWRGNGY